MPRPAVPSQPSVTSQVPGFVPLSSRLGNDGNKPLAAQAFSDSFVNYTNNPKMHTQEEGQSFGNCQEGYFCKTEGNDYNDLLKSYNVRK